jgi:hypothetical protein
MYKFTKRLGQQHWATMDSSATLCGMPMLGNNYAKHLHLTTDGKEKPCEKCEELAAKYK